MQFQLRFSPSLANKPKPKAASADDGPKKPPFNPFENPPAALTICPIEPAHLLVLNKFAIVPEHFLLITRSFQPQTHLLDAADLAATHACLCAYNKLDNDQQTEEGLFAFFNSGPHSGASQPHRHVQFLPVARMHEAGWTLLAETLAAGGDNGNAPQLPFATFAERIHQDMAPEELRAVYIRLYLSACRAAATKAVPTTTGEAVISYNLAMTRNVMVLCPRTAEGRKVVDAESKEVGFLALNGTVLAGTALVKSEAEWESLKEDEGQLWDILGAIGVKSA